MGRTDPICFATGDIRKQDDKQECLSLEDECSRYAQQLHSFSAIRIRISELVDLTKEGGFRVIQKISYKVASITIKIALCAN